MSKLHNLYSSPSIIKMIQVKEDNIGGACSTNGAKRNAYRILVRKPEGKRPLGRFRRGWDDNINMELRDIGCGSMAWIDLAWDRDQRKALVNTVVNLQVPFNVWKFLSSCTAGRFSRRAQIHGVS
jgi:hypothetical protein